MVISPNPGTKPIYEKTNKSFTIKLNTDSLKANTTYSIAFNETISDLNEGNALKNYYYYFSTGDQLDTLTISGSAQYAVPPKKINLKIFCTDNLSGNVFTSKIQKNSFEIHGLNSSQKDIVIFNDENNNSIVEQHEDIGILNDVTPSPDSVSINLYSRKKHTISTRKTGSIFYIFGIPKLSTIRLKKDENIYSFQDTIFGDSIAISILKSQFDKDYFIVSEIIEEGSNVLEYYSVQNLEKNLLEIHFNKSITHIESNVFYSKIKDTFRSGIFEANILYLPYDSSDTYKLIPGSVFFQDGSRNTDSITFQINKIQSAEIYIRNTRKDPILCELKNNKNIYYLYIEPGTAKKQIVPQGTYDLFYFEDSDGNNVLTPPLQIQGKYKYGETWNIKSNIQAQKGLENEIIVN